MKNTAVNGAMKNMIYGAHTQTNVKMNAIAVQLEPKPASVKVEHTMLIPIATISTDKNVVNTTGVPLPKSALPMKSLVVKKHTIVMSVTTLPLMIQSTVVP